MSPCQLDYVKCSRHEPNLHDRFITNIKGKKIFLKISMIYRNNNDGSVPGNHSDADNNYLPSND